jgi:hypothetical protein
MLERAVFFPRKRIMTSQSKPKETVLYYAYSHNSTILKGLAANAMPN